MNKPKGSDITLIMMGIFLILFLMMCLVLLLAYMEANQV